MTVSIVANGFLRNSPIFPLQKPADRVQFARLRAAPSILHINGTPGTGRLLSPEYNDQNITNGGPPCSSSVYSFKRPRSIYVEQL